MPLLSGGDRDFKLYTRVADDPPNVPDPMDDEFAGSTVDTTKWTWLNQGTATARIVAGRLQFWMNNNQDQLRGLYQSTPSGTWKVQAKVYRPTVRSGVAQGAWLFVSESLTGETRGMALWNTDLYAVRRSAPASGSTAAWFSLSGYDVDSVYFQAEWDGTNVVVHSSADGLNWVQYGSYVPTVTPVAVGLGFVNASGDLGFFEFGWFRRVA